MTATTALLSRSLREGIERAMVQRQSIPVLGFGFLLVLAGCRWEEADRFAAGLRCDMSPREVEALATQYGAETFRAVEQPDEYVTHVLNTRSTFFEFYFGKDGLETVRQGTHRAITGGEYSPRKNLCTGEQTSSVEVNLLAPQEWAGASIYVDEKEEATLSPQAYRTILLSHGQHEIRLRKEGYRDLVIPVSYRPGPTRDEIMVPQPEPQ